MSESQPKTVVIIGAGMHYGALGMSHHCREDIAIMRTLPNMVICSPCDLIEAEHAVHAMLDHDGPFCYRCGRKGEPALHEGPIDFQFGKAIQIRNGKDLTLMFTGTVGGQVIPAADELAKDGINCRVMSVHTIKPIDKDAILAAAEETGGIVTVEEHNLNGGFGSAVGEVLLDAGVQPKKFLRLGLPDVYPSLIGGQKWLLDQHGLSAPKIAASARQLLS